MKKRRFLLAFLCLIALVLTLPAAASEGAITLRIEGATDTLFYESVPIAGQTVSLLDVLKGVNAAENGTTIEGLEAGYITAINGEKAGRTARGWDGFGVRLNDTYILFDALSTTLVKNGDEIVVYYADEFGDGLMIPQVDDSNLKKGELRFFAEVPKDDGSYSVEAIVGATIHWYCGDAYASYVTDADGKIKIEDSLLLSGDHRVGIELKNSEGVPLVLRLSPDYTVNIPTDVGDSPAVYIFAALAVMSAAAFALMLNSVARRKKFTDSENK